MRGLLSSVKHGGPIFKKIIKESSTSNKDDNRNGNMRIYRSSERIAGKVWSRNRQ